MLAATRTELAAVRTELAAVRTELTAAHESMGRLKAEVDVLRNKVEAAGSSDEPLVLVRGRRG